MEQVSAAKFRQVLGHFPTGVTVVTAAGEEPVGMAIGSFASVSLDPALVGFFVGRASVSWARIREAGAFCVNVLAHDQEDVCRTFAGPAEDRFRGLGWSSASSGAPVLDGVLAWIDCDLDTVVAAGDHDLVLGRVRQLEVANDAGPLVFFRGGYAQLPA